MLVRISLLARTHALRFALLLILIHANSILPLSAADPPKIPITALVFSTDGSHLFVSGHHSVMVHSVSDRELPRRIPCHPGRVQTIAIHPDGNLIAVGGGLPGSAGFFQLIRWRDSTVTFTATNRADLVSCLAFNSTGSQLVVTASDATAAVFDVDGLNGTLSPRLELKGHSGPVLTAAFSPDNRVIVTAGADRSVKVWNPETGAILRSFNHHTATVHALAFSPATHAASTPSRPAICASGSDDLTVRVWQPEIGRMVRIVRNHHGPIFAVAYHPAGTSLFSAGKEGIVRLIEGDSDAILREWRASDDWIYALALSPNGELLATGDWKGAVALWNITTGQPWAQW